MKEVEADGFLFKFEDAIEAYVFDEKDRSKPTFHGLPMKAVDVVAEFEEAYLFVEIKDFDDPQIYDISTSSNDDEEKQASKDCFKLLKNYLKYKYRDTFLCRYAEQKVDKPVHYVCLLVNFDNALASRMKKDLHPELPVGRKSKRWSGEIARSCQVVNLEGWNRNFTGWPVQRIVPTPQSNNDLPS